jgi:hypothetical protein
MTKLGIVTLFSLVAVGCGDNSINGSASGVFPAQGFTGRNLRVQVSGDFTQWKDGATVTFGDGVTVNKVTVASPTDVFAEITIDPTAQVGTRDVTVTSNGTFTLASAFELVAPVELQTTGKLAQGAIVKFKLVNKDFDNPFDVTQATDPVTGATTFPNLAITGPAGVALQSPLVSTSFTASAYEIDGLALIDVDAQAGTVMIQTGDPSKPVMSVTATLQIAPRTATALTAGTPASGMIGVPLDSTLYSLAGTGNAPELARFAVAPQTTAGTASANAPIVVVLGPSGHWATDFLGASATPHAIDTTAGALYAIVTDLGGTSNYAYGVLGLADHLTVATAPAAGANGTTTTAITAAAEPFFMTGGKLAASTTVSFVKFVASPADVGKVFHVTTMDGPDPNTDVVVDVQKSDSAHTSISNGPQGGCSLFGGCGAEFDSNAIPSPGTYFFKITAGANFATTDDEYAFLFWVQ